MENRESLDSNRCPGICSLCCNPSKVGFEDGPRIVKQPSKGSPTIPDINVMIVFVSESTIGNLISNSPSLLL